MLHDKLIVILLLIPSYTLICALQKNDVSSKPNTEKLQSPELVNSASPLIETQYVIESDQRVSTTQRPINTTTSKPPSTTPPDVTTTTTTVPITTTPAPSPYPDAQVGTWNSSCIMIKMAAQLSFTYDTKENATKHGLYNIPKDAQVEDADCNNNTQSITLNWGPGEAQQSFFMQFDNRNKSVYVSMIRIILSLLPEDFPDAKENETYQFVHRATDDFKTPVKMSYHCTRAQHFNLTETIGDEKIIGTMKINDVQLEAFRLSNSTGFSNVHDCDSSETSDVVPVAVGIALVALILIVLISYLCARRRSTSRGYMSF